MTDVDPYATLGVPRTATRDDIARAFRRLAKQHHPDAGAPPSAEMARINDAWHTLSDPARRARWDRRHAAGGLAPPHWTAAPARPYPQAAPHPTAAPAVPPTRLDSGWAAAAIVAGVAVVVGVVMIGIAIATRPTDTSVALDTPVLSLRHPPDWARALGDGDDPPEHRVVAHLATWDTDPAALCTAYGEECGIQANAIPPGESLILITSHEGGEPPIPDPVRSLPYGLDADTIIGGAPAAVERTQVEPGLVLTWWQLSPPGFPERWIEIRALTRETVPPEDGGEGDHEIGELIGSLEFR